MTPLDRRRLLKRLGLAAAAASLPSAAGAESVAAAVEEASGNFPSHPRWRFYFLSHQTTNPLFVPLQYGAQDACAVFGCDFAWRGNAKEDVGALAKAVDAAVAAKAGGIALMIPDPTALNAAVERVLRAAIPVVAFHADASEGGYRRLPYIGHDRRAAAPQIAGRIARAVGRGRVAFFGDPVSARLQLDVFAALSSSEVRAILISSERGIYAKLTAVEGTYLKQKDLRGLFGFDVDSTHAIAQTLEKHRDDGRKLSAGGYGVLPATLKLIDEGRFDFTVDEQPYLQGFAAVTQLFLAKLSGGLVTPSNVRTGPIFVTKATVKPYVTTRTRYEGSSSKQKYPIS